MNEGCQDSRDYSAKSTETLHYWILTEPLKYLELIHSAEKTLTETSAQRNTEPPAPADPSRDGGCSARSRLGLKAPQHPAEDTRNSGVSRRKLAQGGEGQGREKSEA